jgi:hypothetical protein
MAATSGKTQNVTALQLKPNDHIALGVDAMNLKNGLRDVETDRHDSVHVRSSE